MSSSMASAATFQVSNTNDSGPGSLRQAVLDANINPTPDEIIFDSSIGNTIALTSGPIEIRDALIITGPGAQNLTINAGHSFDIFDVPGGSISNPYTVSISSLTLANGVTAIDADSYGDVELTVADSVITGSSDTGIYLSAYTWSASLAVTDTVITNNEEYGVLVSGSRNSGYHQATLERTSIVDNTGYGVVSVAAQVDVIDSVVSGNSTGLGAAADYYTPGVLSVSETTITSNLSHGVQLFDIGKLTLENSTVASNGGAGVYSPPPVGLYVARASAHILDSTISDNSAGGVTMDAIYNEIILENATISGNHNGPGVQFDLTYAYESSHITNSTITGNDLGGINDLTSASNSREIVLENSVVAENGSGDDLLGTGTYTVHHSLIQNPGTATLVEPSPGSNIIGVAPMLGTLQDNGGTTLTHELLSGSPAIDQGENLSCLNTDQRGIVRPQDGDSDNLATCDMGAFELAGSSTSTGVIGDRVWRDINGNGVQDTNEPGLAGVAVKLRINCDANNTLTAITNSNGDFQFDGLGVGTYQLEFIKPDGYSFSPYIAAGDYRIDSNADPATGLDQCRSLSTGQSRLALDAGLVPSLADGSGIMGNYVWSDDNGDGTQDATEPGLAGVTVRLHIDCNPTTWLSTFTDANGGFMFDRLPVKNYRLEFVAPDGFTFSPPIAAGDYDRDSNADPNTGRDKCRAMPEGRERLALDAGLVPSGLEN